MILTMVFLAMWAVLIGYPQTPAGQPLRNWLVVRPARWMACVRRGHVALGVLVCLIVVGLVWLVGEEGARLIGMGTPELASWAAMVDLTSILDVAVTAVLAGSALRLGRLKARVRMLLPQRRARPRAHVAPDNASRWSVG